MPIPKNVPGGNPNRRQPGGGNNPNNRNREGASTNRPNSQQSRIPNQNPNQKKQSQNTNRNTNSIEEQRRDQAQRRQQVRGQGEMKSTSRASEYGGNENLPNYETEEAPKVNRRPQSTHTEEYDFEERSFDNSFEEDAPRNNYDAPPRRRSPDPEPEPFVNEYDDNEDDTFTSMSIDEQLNLEDAEDLRSARNSQNQDTQNNNYEEEEEYFEPAPLDDYEDDDEDEEEEPTPPPKKSSKKIKKNRKDKKGQDVFINEKKGTIKPFGGNRKIKEHEYDKRKNMRKNAMIVQWVVIGLIVILIGLGVKNAVFPPDTLSEQETADIAAATVGLTNFPLEEGEGFAKDFMQAYLTINADDVSDKVLGYYYTGSLSDGDSNNLNKEATMNYKQKILYGPTVYDAYAFNDYSARFTIGSLVKPEVVEGKTPSGVEPKWEFFNVNVYYNSAADTFAITDDSPTIVPASEVGTPADIPERVLLGTGESDQALAGEIESVVFGFLQGYAESSPTNHSSIDQYITNSKDSELIKGLDGEYEFSGELSDSIQIEAFPTVDSEEQTEIKALTTVKWANKIKGIDSETRVDYTSTYVITLEKIADKWLISKFQPQYYASEDAEKPVVPEGDDSLDDGTAEEDMADETTTEE